MMASSGVCAHLQAITTVKHPKRQVCEECEKIGADMGSSAHLPAVRRDALLRRLAEPARQQARAKRPAIR